MTSIEERIDALEEFLLATSSLNRFLEANKRIADKLDPWNNPQGAIDDFNGICQCLESEPYCHDRRDFNEYLLKTYGLGADDDVPALEERRKRRLIGPDFDALYDLTLNRLAIYVEMYQNRGVISWIDEVNISFNMKLSHEIEVIKDIMSEVLQAAQILLKKYPSQRLIEAGLEYCKDGE